MIFFILVYDYVGNFMIGLLKLYIFDKMLLIYGDVYVGYYFNYKFYVKLSRFLV